MANRWGNNGNSEIFYFGRLQNHCRWWPQPWNWKTLLPWKKSNDQPRQHIKKQRHYFANKGPSSQLCFFPIVMYQCECWTIKKAECWGLDDFELWYWRLESRLDCKEIQPVNYKRKQSWILIGRTDAEAETPKLWPPDAKSWLIWKDPNIGKDCRQKEKEMTEDEMVGWHHQIDGHWIWTRSGSWWWTGKTGVLQSMG